MRNSAGMGCTSSKKYIISGVNGVVVARDGLILWENGATGSRKVSRHLPGFRDGLKTSKMVSTVEIQKK